MPENQLTQAEINALIAGAKGGERAAIESPQGRQQQKAIKTYNFERPDKFSKDQLKTLGAIHETIGRLAGARLSERLHTNVNITAAEPEQLSFKEFVAGLTPPTLLFTATAPQLSGPFLLEVDLALAIGWVDRVLGGAGELPKDRRDLLTPIEESLIVRLVDELIPAIAEGWSQVDTVTPMFDNPLTRPDMLRVAGMTDVVANITYEVRYPGASAPISMCMPYDSLEPVMAGLSTTQWFSTQKSTVDLGAKAELSATLQNVEVPLTAVLGGVELTVDELSSLKPGDVIRFGDRADHPVRLTVMDQAMAWAAPGRVGDRVAVRLLTPLQQLMEA
ncbi:MAG: flagellar motor switch protein FliM [Chloroflexota bacterium]